jgi:type IV secretion system protein VirB4
MTRVKTEQRQFVPWFAKAGAACSIVPIARFVGPNIFALKGAGYGCLFSLTRMDEERLTDLSLMRKCGPSRARCVDFPKDRASLYQYTG